MAGSQAAGLGMLDPIQLVSSWTADTSVEESKDILVLPSWSPKVLCVCVCVCPLCSATPGVCSQQRGMGVLLPATGAQATAGILLCLSLAQNAGRLLRI